MSDGKLAGSLLVTLASTLDKVFALNTVVEPHSLDVVSDGLTSLAEAVS